MTFYAHYDIMIIDTERKVADVRMFFGLLTNGMILKNIFKKKGADASFNLDLEAIIGEKCVVVEKINSF